jgi:hypothetical protein
MSLWFEIAVVVLLAAVVFQLFGIEGNIADVANAIHNASQKANRK